MKVSIKAGTTSRRIFVFLQDSSSTTGAGLTGLTSGSAGLLVSCSRDDDGNAGATTCTLTAGTRGTYTNQAGTGTGGGFVEKDSTNQKGVYEFSIPDAWLVAGSNTVVIMFQGATNLAPCPVEIQLEPAPVDVQKWLGATAPANTGDAFARLGAPTGASVSVDIAGIKAKTDSLTFTVSGQVDCNVQYVNDVLIRGVGTNANPWGPSS